MTSFRRLRHVGLSVVAFAGLTAMASCGSRTGLFVDEVGLGGPVGPTAIDGGRDVVNDVVNDVVDEPTACIPGTFNFTPAIPQLMFVLDRSGSMKFVLDADRVAQPPFETSRWSALQDALSQTITSFSDSIAMGALFFPSADADAFDPTLACSQDPPSAAITPALGNAAAILGVFKSTSPVGGTPTAPALQQAVQAVSPLRAVSRAIVLATDGAPNCNDGLDKNTCTCTSSDPTDCQKASDSTSCLDDVRTIATISDIAGTRNIPVYVVGIGVTSSFASTLDSMAIAGGKPRNGTPRYYAADTPGELTDAFGQIRDQVAKCSYITPSAPTDPNAIVVELNGKVLPRDPTHTNGWDWVDQAYGHLQLYGAACDNATATNVSGTVGCNDH